MGFGEIWCQAGRHGKKLAKACTYWYGEEKNNTIEKLMQLLLPGKRRIWQVCLKFGYLFV
jgi:hypothetical protein